MSSTSWGAFLIAALLFIQVPGPSLLFTIGRALTVSRRAALWSVVGNGVGVTVQALLVAAGIGGVVAASANAYLVIKILGAGYVIWLGIQAIRTRNDGAPTEEQSSGRMRRSPVLVGILVGITNPKTVLFFAAFLPQFTDPAAGPIGPQLALLGLVFGVMAVCSDSLWAIAASRARDWFGDRPQRLVRLRTTGGALMVSMGAALLIRD